MARDMSKAKLGQYFTPEFVADFMISLTSKGPGCSVLEPASGQGVFLQQLASRGYRNLSAYEIDPGLPSLQADKVKRQSFISADPGGQFDLIIGNPPYVRWKNLPIEQKVELQQSDLWHRYFNSLSDYLYIFILKSVELLKDGGELIFVTPEYWFTAAHARALRDYMVAHGCFEQIYHFNETPVFAGVRSSIVIFKFVKGRTKRRLRVCRFDTKQKLEAADVVRLNGRQWQCFEIDQFSKGQSWVLAPAVITDELQRYEAACKTGYAGFHQTLDMPATDTPYVRLGDIADIANGLVSGLDRAFRLPPDADLTLREKQATLQVIKAKDIEPFRHREPHNYIFLNKQSLTETSLQKQYPHFYGQLREHKDKLMARYDYGRRINYWDWVFLRSFALFTRPATKIFVPGKERLTNKDRLRFCLAERRYVPTQDVTAVYLKAGLRESIYYILAVLNSSVIYDWVRYKGALKGGIAEFSERPLAAIPIRLIDWRRPREAKLHGQIVRKVQNYLSGSGSRDEIEALVLRLLQ